MQVMKRIPNFQGCPRRRFFMGSIPRTELVGGNWPLRLHVVTGHHATAVLDSSILKAVGGHLGKLRVVTGDHGNFWYGNWSPRLYLYKLTTPSYVVLCSRCFPVFSKRVVTAKRARHIHHA